jgi:hypothetical protein
MWLFMPPELTNYQVSLCVSFICPVHIPGGGSLLPVRSFFTPDPGSLKIVQVVQVPMTPHSHSTYICFSLYPSYQLHHRTPPAIYPLRNTQVPSPKSPAMHMPSLSPSSFMRPSSSPDSPSSYLVEGIPGVFSRYVFLLV